tara:strand:+ start:2655 stop:3662 length:1008 start_codon:yes stop_codon:yes gene_type:complete
LKTITLRLRNSRDKRIKKLDLTADLINHPAVNEWYRRFKFELDSGAHLDKGHLFLGQSVLSKEELMNNINNTLDEIEAYDFVANTNPTYPVYNNPQIPERLTLEDLEKGHNNEKMNIIHNYFPTLAGPYNKTTNWMYVATEEIRECICRLNEEVHELHTVLQHEKDEHLSLHISISWHRDADKLTPLPDIFNELFRKDVKNGDLLLGYPQVGKTHIEAWSEQDEELEDEHIDCIEKLSGDFLLKLSPSLSYPFLDDFDEWLEKQGLDPEDEQLRLGWAVMGKLRDVDKLTKDRMSKYDDIEQISCHDEEGIHVYDFPFSRFDDEYKQYKLEHLND